MKRTHPAGVTLIELLVLGVLLGTLLAIAMPTLQSVRQAAAFRSAEQEVSTALTRARWLAINSGRPATRVELTSPTLLTVRVGTAGAVLFTTDVTDESVTLSATNLPFDFDGRGMVSGAAPAITMTGPTNTKTLVVSALGKVS